MAFFSLVLNKSLKVKTSAAINATHKAHLFILLKPIIIIIMIEIFNFPINHSATTAYSWRWNIEKV